MTESDPEISIEQVREACRNSLWALCTGYLGYHDWDKCHDDLETFLNRPSRRKLIQLPRGHLKTSIVTIGYSIKTLLKNPNARILIVNEVWDNARKMLYEIKEYLTNKSLLPKLFGAFESNRWTSDEIVIRQRNKALAAASIATTGLEAESTSQHADLIIADDIQGFQNCQTKEQRDKVKRYYRSLVDILEQNGELILLGTRWHQDDVYAEILEREAQYFDMHIRSVVENNKIIFPKKFNKKFSPVFKDWIFTQEPTMDYIEHLKVTKRREFFAQYMNNPLEDEGQLFKASYLKYWNRYPSALSLILSIDPAVSQAREADSSGLVVSGLDPENNLFIVDAIKAQGIEATVDAMVNLLRAHSAIRAIVIEDRGFQVMYRRHIFDALQKHSLMRPIESFKGTSVVRAKEQRIEALQPYFAQGKAFLKPGLTDFEGELLAFPNGKHDDLIDSLSMAMPTLMPSGHVSNRRELKPGTLAWVLKKEFSGTSGQMYDRYLSDVNSPDMIDWNKKLYGKALETITN
jgi:predicted phage terminase large subunit-like protein